MFKRKVTEQLYEWKKMQLLQLAKLVESERKFIIKFRETKSAKLRVKEIIYQKKEIIPIYQFINSFQYINPDLIDITFLAKKK